MSINYDVVTRSDRIKIKVDRLKIIEDRINRLEENSLQQKKWAISFVVAIIAFADKELKSYLLIPLILALLAFGFFDHIYQNKAQQILKEHKDMANNLLKQEKFDFRADVALSSTLLSGWYFYLMLIVFVVIMRLSPCIINYMRNFLWNLGLSKILCN